MLPFLIAYLESQASEQGCPLAHGLAVAVKAFNFVATVYLLSDILPQVSRLSLVFQTANVNLSLIKPQVSPTITTIRRFKSSPGPYYKKLDEALSSLEIDVTLEKKERFKTHISHKYIDAITTNLEDCFPNTDTSIIGSFSVFDPQKTPHEKAEDFFTYGDDDIDILACHFNQTIDKEALVLEWIGFKEMLANQFTQLSSSEVMQHLVQEEIALLYPELAKLANIALVIPFFNCNM